MNRKVKFRVTFSDGQKLLKLKEVPSYNMTQGLIVITDKDINEYSLNKTMTDLIAGEDTYGHPELAEDNFITEVFIKGLPSN